MTHILFTVTNDLTYDQRMDRICTVLTEEGYKVTLVGRKKKDSIKLKEKKYNQKRIPCLFAKGKLFYMEYNLRLFFVLLFSRFDVLCSVDLDTILPGYVVARFRKKKLVYDAHEYFTEVIELVRRPGVKKIWEAIEGFVLPRIRYAYTVSEGLKKIYEEKYSLSFEIIRNVPVLEKLEPLKKKDKHLVYIGAVNEGRGLEELIEAMPSIDSCLHIYGKGDLYQMLVNKVDEKKLMHKVKFYGYLEPVELRERTREAYIGVLLLRYESLSYYYSLANKFFDYMHAGIPQVVIDFPEYRAINESYKVACLTSLNKDEIIRSINKLLNDEAYYQELKDNCYKAREVFNWQEESKKLIHFYSKVVKDN